MAPVSPRPASTVLVVRPRSTRLEVLMVRRPTGGFFGGLMVFPGGAVEECDLGFDGGIDGGPDGGFDDVQFRMAGLRETAEEVGFLVTPEGFAPSPRLRGDRLMRHWDVEGLVPGLDRMTLVSRWVTPEIAPKRFDTRFYLVPLEGDPDIVLDEDELEDHVWVTPGEALDRMREGRWQMILPTVSHLRWLDRRASVEEAVASADGADGRTLIEPIEVDGRLHVRYRAAP